MTEQEKPVEIQVITIDLNKADQYYKFIKEVCRVVNDTVNAVFSDEVKAVQNEAKLSHTLYVREDDELVKDSKSIANCVLVCDGVAPDYLDTSFGRILFARRSRLRMHEVGLLGIEGNEIPDGESPDLFYSLDNSKPFELVRKNVLRQLETEHMDRLGPTKKILAVNHLPVTNVPHLWELPWEERIKIWEKHKHMHRSTTPPRSVSVR